jgi:hypothetical protein
MMQSIRYSSKCNERLYSPKKLRVKFSNFMVQSEVSSDKPKATINSLPLEVDSKIMEWLPHKDALNLAKALKLPEKVAVQYSACEEDDLEDICDDPFFDKDKSK